MRHTVNSITALAVLIFASSCFNENDRFQDGQAKVNVYLVDAPADYDEVWVEILGIKILPSGKAEEQENSWMDFNYEGNSQMVNLLTLVGHNRLHLAGVELPAGKINQIRLLLGENNYLIKDGQRIELKTPSAQQSGLKLKINQEIQAGLEYDLVIDFDAARSIVRAGNSGQFILRPVLRAVAETSASIQGIVFPTDSSPVVYAVLNSDTVSTFTDENGFFRLRGLDEGSYRVIIEPASPYAPLVFDEVQTEAGRVKDLGVINLVESE
jgi:hypothetical protein